MRVMQVAPTQDWACRALTCLPVYVALALSRMRTSSDPPPTPLSMRAHSVRISRFHMCACVHACACHA
mgnify:CR=1 FL=1